MTDRRRPPWNATCGQKSKSHAIMGGIKLSFSCLVTVLFCLLLSSLHLAQAFYSTSSPNHLRLQQQQQQQQVGLQQQCYPPFKRRTTSSSFVLFLDKKTQLFNNNNDDDDDNDVVEVVKGRGGDDGYDGLGEYDPSENIRPERETIVGNPQIRLKEKERSVTSILKELAAIQQQGPQKYCILGTRHCSYLHQQIIELLAYALVLSGNHVYTSGAGGTHAATIRGALRAEREDLLTVVLPQSMGKQPKESQELLKKVKDVIAMPHNDDKGLDVASRICNSYLLAQTDQLISFAFHESNTVIEANKEAKKLDMLVTTLYLD